MGFSLHTHVPRKGDVPGCRPGPNRHLPLPHLHSAAVLPAPCGEPLRHRPHPAVHWPGQRAPSLPAPPRGPLKSDSAQLTGSQTSLPSSVNKGLNRRWRTPNPRSCVLAGGGDASFQLSKPERGMTRQGRTQAPSSSNGRPQHWLLSGSQPPPPSQGSRGLSSSLVFSNGQSPPHQAGRRQSQKQWWWRGRSRHRDWQHRGPGLS